jgi:hypothetical protein
MNTSNVVALSDRVRPACEAAPWVQAEIKVLESSLDESIAIKNMLVDEIKRLQAFAKSAEEEYKMVPNFFVLSVCEKIIKMAG